MVHVEGDKLDLSLRNSRTNPSDKVEVRDPEIQELGDLVKGQVVRGYVKAVTDVGVFVRYKLCCRNCPWALTMSKTCS